MTYSVLSGTLNPTILLLCDQIPCVRRFRYSLSLGINLPVITGCMVCCVVKPCGGVVVYTKSPSPTACRDTDGGRLCGGRSRSSFLHADVTRSLATTETWSPTCRMCRPSRLSSTSSVAVVTVVKIK